MIDFLHHFVRLVVSKQIAKFYAVVALSIAQSFAARIQEPSPPREPLAVRKAFSRCFDQSSFSPWFPPWKLAPVFQE